MCFHVFYYNSHYQTIEADHESRPLRVPRLFRTLGSLEQGENHVPRLNGVVKGLKHIQKTHMFQSCKSFPTRSLLEVISHHFIDLQIGFSTQKSPSGSAAEVWEPETALDTPKSIFRLVLF